MADELLNPVQQMQLRVREREKRRNDVQSQLAIQQELAAKEAEGPTFIGEVGRTTWGAAVDLTSESFIVAKDLARTVLPLDNVIMGARYKLAGLDFGAGVAANEQANREFNDDLRRGADELAPANETMLGAGARGILQFVTPYMGLARAAGGLNSFRSATAGGALIDYSLFDPNEGNLSKLLNELDPETSNAALEFIATDPDDSEALNRFRNALEGGVLGSALEGIFRMARFARGRKVVEEGRQQAMDAPERPLDDIKAEAEAEFKAEAEEAAAAPVEPQPKPDAGAEAAADAPAKPAVSFQQTLRETLKLDPDARRALNEALMADDDEAVTTALKDFNFDRIDWEAIGDDADNIAKLIDTVSTTMADYIDDVKGGVQAHRHTQKLADLVGATGEQVQALYKDVRGDRGITARMLAADKTLLASAKRLYKLREVARANPGDLKSRAAFMEQAELHVALQAHVKGARTEIARALNGMKIIRADADEGFQEFDSVLRQFGGGGNGSRSFDKMMDSLLDGRSLSDLNARLRMTTGQRIKNSMIEYVINAMLSSPKTHLINFTSNVLNTFMYTGDRYLAATGGVLRGEGLRAYKEANLDLVSKFSRLDEAFKLARQAWKDGAPVSDKRQRVEFRTRKSLSVSGTADEVRAGDELLPEEGTTILNRAREVTRNDAGEVIGATNFNPLQRMANTFGNIVRIPGRALVTGDEFFKAINRNAEVTVLSYREAVSQAEKQGLAAGTPKYEKFVEKTMRSLADPSNNTVAARNIRVDAVEKSRLVTFQEAPRTPGGAIMERAINHNAFIKLVVAPFFRTPMNILRQSLVDRTPLGLILADTRDVIRRGGPEASEAIARMTSGVAAMSAFYAFTGTDVDSKFQVIGKVPYDSSLKAQGVLDYSVRIGDKWYQFNRLDPMGTWLGMMADAKTHIEHGEDDEKSFAFMQGALAGLMNNVTNKTWAKSLSDLFDLAEGAMSNKPVTTERAVAQFLSGEVGKLIPQLAKSVGRVALDGEERESKEAWTLLDGLNAQLPVLNRDVPPRHDFLGRKVTWPNSATSIFNPFAVSETPTPLEVELGRLNFTVRPMRKNLGNGMVELTAAEYSKLTGLVGEVQVSRDGNLEESLKALVESEDYQEWPDPRRAMVVKRYIEAARSAARGTFLLSDDLSDRLKKAKKDDLASLLEPPL